MIVRSSHLALRFYEHDGWTEEVLKKCLNKGEIEFWGGLCSEYWRLTMGSSFNVDKLMKHVTKVERWHKEENKESDKEYIKMMNW